MNKTNVESPKSTVFNQRSSACWVAPNVPPLTVASWVVAHSSTKRYPFAHCLASSLPNQTLPPTCFPPSLPPLISITLACLLCPHSILSSRIRASFLTNFFFGLCDYSLTSIPHFLRLVLVTIPVFYSLLPWWNIHKDKPAVVKRFMTMSLTSVFTSAAARRDSFQCLWRKDTVISQVSAAGRVHGQAIKKVTAHPVQ